MALLPTLAQQILEDMDIETLIQELQDRASSLANSKTSLASISSLPPSSLSSSVEMVQELSDSDSVAPSEVSTGYSGNLESSISDLSASGLQSWVAASPSVPLEQSIVAVNRSDAAPEGSRSSEPSSSGQVGFSLRVYTELMLLGGEPIREQRSIQGRDMD